MVGFFDNFRWLECECIDWSERRNVVVFVVVGILVSEKVWVVIFMFYFLF